MSDEPVAYLGGDQGEAPPPADPPPPAEDEVDGYLGGAAADQAPAADEDLPALPPQESATEYSANDFLDPNAAQEAPAEDPYADPYAQAPAQEQGYGDYEGYDSAAVEQADPSYFDSMAHGSATEDAAPPAEEYAAEGEDPDQPKTISQQDAESIIRRITTKRILPPDSGAEKKPVAPPPPKLTESGSGLRIWPILFVIVVVGGMAVAFFGEQIAEAVPELRPLLFWLPPKEPPKIENVGPKVDPNEVAKKKFLETLLLSEAKAFGVPVKDVPAAVTAPRPGAGAGDAGATGGTSAPGGSEAAPAGGTTTGGGQ